MRVEPTPNPNSVKFTVDRPLTQGRGATYRSGEEADHPLARRLLEVEGVEMVFMLNNFVTVTRRPGADWNTLVPACRDRIVQYLKQEGAPEAGPE